MIDPELQNYLSGINQSLTEIKNKKTPGLWRAFFNGLFSAFGYVVGIVIILLILGWILNRLGFLGTFQGEWQKFTNFISEAEGTMGASQNAQQGSVQSGQIYTLPNGQKVEVMPVK